MDSDWLDVSGYAMVGDGYCISVELAWSYGFDGVGDEGNNCCCK